MVRDAETAHRALPLWAKILVATGFAVTGWLLAATLGGFSASAAESPDQDTTSQDTRTDQVPALGQVLNGTLTTLSDTANATLTTSVDTVSTTLTTTVNTVTATMGTVTNVVDTTTDAVVAPVTNTVLQPVTAGPARSTGTKTANTAPVTATRADTRATTTTAHTAAAPPSPEQAPVPALRAEPAAPQPMRQQPRQAVTPPKTTETAHTMRARDGAPSPLPTQPPAQTGGITVSHDNANNGKNPLAILTKHAGPTDLLPVGTPRSNTFVDSGRDPALPTTSPD